MCLARRYHVTFPVFAKVDVNGPGALSCACLPQPCLSEHCMTSVLALPLETVQALRVLDDTSAGMLKPNQSLCAPTPLIFQGGMCLGLGAGAHPVFTFLKSILGSGTADAADWNFNKVGRAVLGGSCLFSARRMHNPSTRAASSTTGHADVSFPAVNTRLQALLRRALLRRPSPRMRLKVQEVRCCSCVGL